MKNLDASSPIFSIIMASYNYEKYIGNAIESVLSQTFKNWELIIVDDASCDNSWEIIQGYLSDTRIKAYKHEKNYGACAAYNLALLKTSGRYIASLDADDLFHSQKLEKQLELFDLYDMDICCTYVREIDHDGEYISKEYEEWFNNSNNNRLNSVDGWLWQNRICHSSAVIRRDFHIRVGQFDNTLIYSPDWQFWIRCLIHGGKFFVYSTPLVNYRNHGKNITHQNYRNTLLEHLKTCENILLPWLQEQSKTEEIAKLIRGFLTHKIIMEDSQAKQDMLKAVHKHDNMSLLFLNESINLCDERGVELKIVQESKNWLETQWLSLQEQLKNKDAELKTVQESKNWLETQWLSLQEQLKNKDAELKTVQESKNWLETQWLSLQEQLKNKDAELKVIQEGKDWLEFQWLSLQEQLKDKDTELKVVQEGKDWLESQWLLLKEMQDKKY